MKIRTDFVTNSSSSSYVIVTEPSSYNEVMESLHPIFRHIFEYELSSPVNKNFMGKDVFVFLSHISSEDVGYSLEDGQVGEELLEELKELDSGVEDEQKIIEGLRSVEDWERREYVPDAISYAIQKLEEKGALIQVEYC